MKTSLQPMTSLSKAYHGLRFERTLGLKAGMEEVRWGEGKTKGGRRRGLIYFLTIDVYLSSQLFTSYFSWRWFWGRRLESFPHQNRSWLVVEPADPTRKGAGLRLVSQEREPFLPIIRNQPHPPHPLPPFVPNCAAPLPPLLYRVEALSSINLFA